MTGLEQALQITPSSGLSPDEIERLIIEAETSIEKDRGEKELIVERNRLDTLIRNSRRAMSEIGKSLGADEQPRIPPQRASVVGGDSPAWGRKRQQFDAPLTRALEAELSFYAQVFGFRLSDAFAPVQVVNLR